MRGLLRLGLVAVALVAGAFVGSILYAGWKSNPDLPEHARAR